MAVGGRAIVALLPGSTRISRSRIHRSRIHRSRIWRSRASQTRSGIQTPPPTFKQGQSLAAATSIGDSRPNASKPPTSATVAFTEWFRRIVTPHEAVQRFILANEKYAGDRQRFDDRPWAFSRPALNPPRPGSRQALCENLNQPVRLKIIERSIADYAQTSRATMG
jgi:hypothetical protein